MEPLGELRRNPVVLQRDGATCTFTRKKGGKVSAHCSCTFYGEEAWCFHLINELVALTDDDLQDLALGTRLFDLASEVDCQAEMMENALTALRKELAELVGPALSDLERTDAVGSAAYDFACAHTEFDKSVLTFLRNAK